jgi:hypothetical protein
MPLWTGASRFQRLCVLAVDPIADTAQQREVAEVLGGGGAANHLSDRATPGRGTR